MDYVLLVFSCALIALQFTANKVYQRNCMRKSSDIMLYPIITAAISFAIFSVIGLIGGDFQQSFIQSFGNLSFWVALIQAILSTLSLVLGVVIAKHGSMAIYSVFMMLGGMIFASVYGICTGESVSASKIIGICVLIAAIIIPVIGKGQKVSLKFFAMCLLAFALNGTFSMLSTIHSKGVASGEAISTNALLYWNYLLTLFISVVAYTVMRVAKIGAKSSEQQSNAADITAKSGFMTRLLKNVTVMIILSSVLYAVSSSFGYFLQLDVLERLDASIVTPLVAGLTIVMSAIAGLAFFKEKPDLKNLIAIGVTLVGVALVILDGTGVLVF